MLAALLVVTAQAFPVFAENQDSSARYSITKTDNGFVRLDKKTGSVSICTTVGSGLKCRLGADERSAWQKELASIKSALSQVQKRLDILEAENQSTRLKAGKKGRSEEEEFDRALKFADKAFRHFFGLMQELKPEPKKDAI